MGVRPKGRAMKRRRAKKFAILASILVFILAGYFYLEQELQDNLLVQGEAQLNNIAIYIMNTSVSETLKNRPAVE